ncbi:MAG: NAD(P)-binding domain-containing protein [Myxococcales bacterium]|nr:NAD(P)-binding domain-containing protein [Myxococcales bacterium]
MYEVIVIGAGPAGIAAATQLGDRGIEVLVLEKGTRVLGALRQVNPRMKLLTPVCLSTLHGMRVETPSRDYLNFGELIAELEVFVRERAVQVQLQAEVTKVERSGQHFVVTLQGGQQLESRYLVDASGMIDTPHIPPIFERWLNAPTTRCVHSLDVRSEDLATARRLLVVGGSTSGFEVIEFWDKVRPHDAKAWMSTRGFPVAVPHRILGIDIHYLLYYPEKLPAHLPLVHRLFDNEKAIGLRALSTFAKGVVKVVPEVKRLDGDKAYLTDGRTLNPDLIVLATGFEHSAWHLGRTVKRDSKKRPLTSNCESTELPDLFVLGTKFSRNLASSFLRGIARDAQVVADRIASRRT